MKEQRRFFSKRKRAHHWGAHQWHLLLSALSYPLIEALRRTCLEGTVLQKAQGSTIPLKGIKMGAVIRKNTRSIGIALRDSDPLKSGFESVYKKLIPM